MTDLNFESIRNAINQFGQDVPIKKIALYLHDEFMIPYDKAVELIYEHTN